MKSESVEDSVQQTGAATAPSVEMESTNIPPRRGIPTCNGPNCHQQPAAPAATIVDRVQDAGLYSQPSPGSPQSRGMKLIARPLLRIARPPFRLDRPPQ